MAWRTYAQKTLVTYLAKKKKKKRENYFAQLLFFLLVSVKGSKQEDF